MHARELAGERCVTVVDVEAPALVLGSTQLVGDVDPTALAEAGVELARRRSGGGAVLVEPGTCLWVDFDIGRSDPLWDDDVCRSFAWVGRAFVAALADMGIVGVTHDGPLVPSPWSRQVCFAGLGPGEVNVGAAKLVGLAQRRTRAGARIGSLVLDRWDPGPLLDLLALAPGQRLSAARDLANAATGLASVAPATGLDDLEAALFEHLP